MADGTIVKMIPLSAEQSLYDDFLHVLWPGNGSFQKVETRRYIDLQFLVAGSYGADVGSFRREADAVYKELYGY